MVNKKFSLYDAYGFGSKIVINNFGFFFVAMLLAGFTAFFALVILGTVDYMMYKEQFESMINLVNQAMDNPFGFITYSYSQNSTTEQLSQYLPTSVVLQLMPKDVVSIDISHENIVSALKLIIPVAILFKLFLETMAVGWTKLALDVQVNKPIEYNYLFKFYYLVPRVLVVEFIKIISTCVCLLFFVFPGIFIYQRLRFSRYFIIDKNQSIIQSLKSSSHLTQNSVVHLCWYSIFSVFLMGLGRILFPSMFFLIPLRFQVDANIYRQMEK